MYGHIEFKVRKLGKKDQKCGQTTKKNAPFCLSALFFDTVT